MALSSDQYRQQLLEKIAPFLPRFAPEDVAGRQTMRHVADPQDLKKFHEIMLEELDSVLAVLNEFEIDAIPGDWRMIANAVLFLTEIDSPVVKWLPRWGVPQLPDALDPRHFELKTSFYDSVESDQKTLMAENKKERTR